MTGWQVHQTAQQSLARFWSVTRSQIYLELGRLEAAGFVEAVGQTGPRARRPYRITEAGRAEFRDWLAAWVAAGPQEDQLRSPLVLTVFFGEFLPSEMLDRLLREYSLQHQRMLDSRLAMQSGLGQRARASLPGTTLDRGIAYHEMTLGWLGRTLRTLSRSRPGRP